MINAAPTKTPLDALTATFAQVLEPRDMRSGYVLGCIQGALLNRGTDGRVRLRMDEQDRGRWADSEVGFGLSKLDSELLDHEPLRRYLANHWQVPVAVRFRRLPEGSEEFDFGFLCGLLMSHPWPTPGKPLTVRVPSRAMAKDFKALLGRSIATRLDLGWTLEFKDLRRVRDVLEKMLFSGIATADIAVACARLVSALDDYHSWLAGWLEPFSRSYRASVSDLNKLIRRINRIKAGLSSTERQKLPKDATPKLVYQILVDPVLPAERYISIAAWNPKQVREALTKHLKEGHNKTQAARLANIPHATAMRQAGAWADSFKPEKRLPPASKKHLSKDQKDQIRELAAMGMSQLDIANKLETTPSTVSRTLNPPKKASKSIEATSTGDLPGRPSDRTKC